ncbi:hypothetical protein GAY31_16600 [Azospirillum brasilense]|nr:hypothetical protein [Azospirillum brasilense]
MRTTCGRLTAMRAARARAYQEREYPGRVSGTDLTNPDFVTLAQSFGAHAGRITETGDSMPAFERAMAAGRLALLELVIDPDAISPTHTVTGLGAGRHHRARRRAGRRVQSGDGAGFGDRGRPGRRRGHHHLHRLRPDGNPRGATGGLPHDQMPARNGRQESPDRAGRRRSGRRRGGGGERRLLPDRTALHGGVAPRRHRGHP